MKILLRKVLIADEHSPFNGLVKDILIINNKIAAIENSIADKADYIINEKDLIVSIGWTDIFSHFCDPGFEYRETLQSGANAAAAGGFTKAFVLPNTNPVVHGKAQVEYIIQKSISFPVSILPLGAITKNIEGKDLAEMYDMQSSGAIAFSDGTEPVQTPGLLLKALQYVKAFDGIIIQMPIDNSIAKHGLVNEGIVSTKLGLPGIPSVAEEIIIKRDIDLLRYTNSKLHITGITTANSVALIANAKKDGLQISCSVTPYHLFFCDEDLHSYDTNLKVYTPLRTRDDMMALLKGVIDGTIDCIASHHIPHNWDSKTCEFEYAKPGMVGLETSFAVVNTVLPNLSLERIIQLFSTTANQLFKLNTTKIEINQIADLTLFSRDQSTTFVKENIKSKSINSPFINTTLKGKVIGIINKGNLYLN